jgi:hypothetical protein
VRVLIYKRTHPFDPNTDGIFGCQDCMGAVRRRHFDAVIGVGGISAEPRGWGIDRRLNWVGVGAHASESVAVGDRGPLVTFDRFILWEEQGPLLKTIAPALARHVYAVHRRVVMSDGLSAGIQHEIRKILSLASRLRRSRVLTRLKSPKSERTRWPCTPPQACANQGRRGKQSDDPRRDRRRCQPRRCQGTIQA